MIVAIALSLQAWAVWGERWGTADNPPSGPNWPVGEIAEGIVAEQTFVMKVPGLRSFTFTPRAVGTTVVGDVIFDVLDVTPEGDRSLFRVIKKGTKVVRDGRPYTLEFSPIDLPVPRTFKVRIALPEAKFGQGFFIDGVERDAYRAGTLVVNFKEVWGDLAFRTDAREARLVGRLDAMGRAWPPFLRSPLVAWTGLAVANGAFAWAVWLALASWHTTRRRHADAVAEPGAAWGRTRAWARTHAFALLVPGAVVALAAIGAASQRERVVVDLARRFPEAEKRTSMPSLHEGFALFDYPTVGVVEPCILALPFSRITWTVDVGPSSMLAVRVGLRPDTWPLEGDGATFRVAVAGPRGYEELRRADVNPQHYETDRRYQLWRFDLSRFSGERLNIVFNVEPGPSGNAVNDAAMWCAPRLIALGRE